MKNILLILLTVSLMSFTVATVYEVKKSTAEVEQVEGYYIFFKSKPVQEYEYLGSVKSGMTATGAPEQLFKNLLKKVKKEYPKADAIIFQDVAMEKVDAVMFK